MTCHSSVVNLFLFFIFNDYYEFLIFMPFTLIEKLDTLFFWEFNWGGIPWKR